MLKLIFAFTICSIFSINIFAKSTVKSEVKNNRKPNQIDSSIIPLDGETEHLLKSSALANEVVEYDAAQKEFHRKAFTASKKIASVVDLKNKDTLYFIYDCLFMIEEGLYLKYSDIPRQKLKLARKIVIQEFER